MQAGSQQRAAALSQPETAGSAILRPTVAVSLNVSPRANRQVP
jgi:hypothetical protein